MMWWRNYTYITPYGRAHLTINQIEVNVVIVNLDGDIEVTGSWVDAMAIACLMIRNAKGNDPWVRI